MVLALAVTPCVVVGAIARKAWLALVAFVLFAGIGVWAVRDCIADGTIGWDNDPCGTWVLNLLLYALAPAVATLVGVLGGKWLRERRHRS